MSANSPKRDESTSRLVIYLAALMFTITMVCFVILAVTGVSTDTLERLVGPLLTGVILTGVVGATHKSQEGRLEKIQHQTNGVLDRRIRDSVNAALDEREGHD